MRRSTFRAVIFTAIFLCLAGGTAVNAQDLRQVEALADRYFQDLAGTRPFKNVQSYFIAESDFEGMLKAIKASPEYKEKKSSRFSDPRNVARFRRNFKRSVDRLRMGYGNLTRDMRSKKIGVNLLYIKRIDMEEQFGMRRYIVRVRLRWDKNNESRERTRRLEMLYLNGKLKIMRIFNAR